VDSAARGARNVRAVDSGAAAECTAAAGSSEAAAEAFIAVDDRFD
jgi:hypothetical protein